MKKLYLIGVLVFVLVAYFATRQVEGQPQPPPQSIIDALNNIQMQLDHIPPAWSRQIPGAERFVVLEDFNGEAVLDRETGLVWEQSPDTDDRTWSAALGHCYGKEVSGRKGWRLPTVEELASLTSVANPIPGEPFQNVQQSFYWSATTSAFIAAQAQVVDFLLGSVVIHGKNVSNHIWCVRGGQGNEGFFHPAE